jgi:hypothetical protein
MNVCMYVCMYVYVCVKVCVYMNAFMSVCMYICICMPCMYVCMFACMHICTYVCICTYDLCICVYACIYVRIYVCMYMYMLCMCVYVCMYVCMYVCIHNTDYIGQHPFSFKLELSHWPRLEHLYVREHIFLVYGVYQNSRKYCEKVRKVLHQLCTCDLPYQGNGGVLTELRTSYGVHVYDMTNSMEQNPSWNVNSRSASYNITLLSRNQS